MPSTTTLYRFYGADGDLLYVGIAKNPIARMAQHRKDKPWWTLIASSTYTHYDSRAAAVEAETAAIHYELPRHNIAGATPRGPMGRHLITVETTNWLRLERVDSRLTNLKAKVLQYDPFEYPHTCADLFWHDNIRPRLRELVGWDREERGGVDNEYLSSQDAYDTAYAALEYELELCDFTCHQILVPADL